MAFAQRHDRSSHSLLIERTNRVVDGEINLPAAEPDRSRRPGAPA